METTDYQQQAIDFLQSTGTTFKAVFEKFDYYFDEDQKRNIFKILLKNSKHKYAFRFGASIKDSTANSDQIIYEKEIDFYCGFKFDGLKSKYLSYSDKISISKIKEVYSNSNKLRNLIDRVKAEKIYKEFLAANTSKYNTVNIMSFERWLMEIQQRLIKKATELKDANFGEAIPNENIIYPTAYDVLTCLTKSDPGTFDDFCGIRL
jgi:hypothetical protein